MLTRDLQRVRVAGLPARRAGTHIALDGVELALRRLNALEDAGRRLRALLDEASFGAHHVGLFVGHRDAAFLLELGRVASVLLPEVLLFLLEPGRGLLLVFL